MTDTFSWVEAPSLRVDARLLTHLEAMGFVHLGFLRVETRGTTRVEFVIREVFAVVGEATFASIVAEWGWDDVTLTTVLQNNVAVVTATGPTKRMDWVDPLYDIEFITSAQSQTLSGIWGAHRLHLEQAVARRGSSPRVNADRELFRAVRVARRRAENRVIVSFAVVTLVVWSVLFKGLVELIDFIASLQPDTLTTKTGLAGWTLLTLAAGVSYLLVCAWLFFNTPRVLIWAARGRLSTQLVWPPD